MANNRKKDNTLIKRSGLILVLNRHGIKRINPEAVVLLEKHLRNNLEVISDLLKQEIDINGRKTARKEDALAVIEKLKSKEEGWEI